MNLKVPESFFELVYGDADGIASSNIDDACDEPGIDFLAIIDEAVGLVRGACSDLDAIEGLTERGQVEAVKAVAALRNLAAAEAEFYAEAGII